MPNNTPEGWPLLQLRLALLLLQEAYRIIEPILATKNIFIFSRLTTSIFSLFVLLLFIILTPFLPSKESKSISGKIYILEVSKVSDGS